MKLIIAGSRHLDEEVVYAEIVSAIRNQRHPWFNATEIVSGTATGADAAGEWYAEFYSIPVKKFAPDWNKYGRAAGPIRNAQMASYGDALLLIWDGKSKGAMSMKNEMLKLGKPIQEILIEESDE